MPQETANTKNGMTTRMEGQENQEVQQVDDSSVRDWKPDHLKPSRMKGPAGIRSTCLFRASPRREGE
jgi:hypothetical protein